MKEDLRKWFGKGKKGDWVRVGTDGEIKGDCARDQGEGKPKCMPRSKAHSMSKKDRASAARRKRHADPNPDRPGTGNKPIMVKTDKKEMNEKNVPTNPKLWAKFKAQAKAKFDVYPSAYANGWAAKQYKAAGGGWKTESVNEMKSFKYLREKSVSQSQQKMMGMALAYKRGEMDDASPEVKKMADSMSTKDLEDFAKTKHKGLPVKKESVELDEAFTPKEIKMAIGVASDKRYAKGNMTGAVNAIEKIKKGLSDHPQVQAVLRRQNESLDEGDALTNKWNKSVKNRIMGSKLTDGKKKDLMAKLKSSRTAADAEMIHQQLDKLGVKESVELGEASLLENLSAWRDAGIDADVAKKVLKGYVYSNKPTFEPVTRPKASEVASGDLFAGKDSNGNSVVVFKKPYEGIYGAGNPYYVRVSKDGAGKTDSIQKAFSGLKGPYVKLSKTKYGFDAGNTRKSTGGQSVDQAKAQWGRDPLAGQTPMPGWATYMNKTFMPKLKPKLDRLVDEIFANLRKLPKDLDRYNRKAGSGWMKNPSQREDAVKLASAIETIAEKGFSDKTMDDYLHSMGKRSGGFGSYYTNEKNFKKAMAEPMGRQKFAKFLLASAKDLHNEVMDMVHNASDAGKAEKKLRGESVKGSEIEEATDFRAGDTVYQVGSKLKGTVLHKGNQDKIVVKFGSISKMIPANQLRLAEDVDLGEAGSFRKKFNKAMTWSKDFTGSPKDMQDRIRSYSDDELRKLSGKRSPAGDGSARQAQIKMIDREMRRRGIKESVDLGEAKISVGDRVTLKPNKNTLDRSLIGKAGVVTGMVGSKPTVKFANGKTIAVSPKDLTINESVELDEIGMGMIGALRKKSRKKAIKGITPKRKKSDGDKKWTKKDHDYLKKNTSKQEPEWDGNWKEEAELDEANIFKKLVTGGKLLKPLSNALTMANKGELEYTKNNIENAVKILSKTSDKSENKIRKEMYTIIANKTKNKQIGQILMKMAAAIEEEVDLDEATYMVTIDKGTFGGVKSDGRPILVKAKSVRDATTKAAKKVKIDPRLVPTGGFDVKVNNKESVEHENCGTPDCCGTCDTDIKEMNFFQFRNRINEARRDAAKDLYFDTYSAAIQKAINTTFDKNKLEVDAEDYYQKVNMGPGKPGRGKTTRHTIDLVDVKTGKPSRKKLHIQIYNRETAKNPYELNYYVS